MEATENPNAKYVIGRGAHGPVYKASLNSGKVYAVKKVLSAGLKSGSKSMIREIQTIGAVRHRNLVKLEEFWFRRDYGLILYNSVFGLWKISRTMSFFTLSHLMSWID